MKTYNHCTRFVILSLFVTSLSGNEEDGGCSLITIYGLKTAECMNLNLVEVPQNLDFDLKSLNLHKNQITRLGPNVFQNYSSLQNLLLVNNRIESVDDEAFRKLRNLQIVDLESNQLTFVPKFAFRYLVSLRSLNLNNNPISYLAADDLIYLTQIETLKFENCRLSRIDPTALQPLTRLFELNLANNQLRHLGHQLASSLGSLTVLRLYNNPWHCDCHLRWLRVGVQAIPNWDFGSNSPICDAPVLLRGVSWKHLSPEKFACPSIIYSLDNHQNASTVEITWGSNATIDCVAWGDPEPQITWTKSGKPVDPRLTSQHGFYSSSLRSTDEKNVRGILNIFNAKRSDTGSYKCIAENSAGRSEVTYQVLLVDKKPSQLLDGSKGSRISVSYEVILGVILGCVLLLGSLLICLVCVVSKRQRARKIVKRRKSNKKHRQLLVSERDKHVNFKSESKINSSSCDQLITNNFEFDGEKINCQLQDGQENDNKLVQDLDGTSKQNPENISSNTFSSRKTSVCKSLFSSSKKSDKKCSNVPAKPDILSNQKPSNLQTRNDITSMEMKLCEDNLNKNCVETSKRDSNKIRIANFSSNVLKCPTVQTPKHQPCKNPICNKPILKTTNAKVMTTSIEHSPSGDQKVKIPNADKVPLKKILKTPSASFDKDYCNNKKATTIMPGGSVPGPTKNNRPPDIYATLPARAKLADPMRSQVLKTTGTETSSYKDSRHVGAHFSSPAQNVEHLLDSNQSETVSRYSNQNNSTNASPCPTMTMMMMTNTTASMHVSGPTSHQASARSISQAALLNNPILSPAYDNHFRETGGGGQSSVANMRRYRNSTNDVRMTTDGYRNSGWSTLGRHHDVSSSTSLHEILSPPFKKSPIIYPKQSRASGSTSGKHQGKKNDYGTAV